MHNTCSLQLAELTETDYFCTNARIEYITIDSHCIEQNGEHTERLHLFLFQTVSLKSYTQAESASSVICASVLLNFVGYTSRSSHTPSSLLPIAPLVHRSQTSQGYPSSTTWRWGRVAAKHSLCRFCAVGLCVCNSAGHSDLYSLFRYE